MLSWRAEMVLEPPRETSALKELREMLRARAAGEWVPALCCRGVIRVVPVIEALSELYYGMRV